MPKKNHCCRAFLDCCAMTSAAARSLSVSLSSTTHNPRLPIRSSSTYQSTARRQRWRSTICNDSPSSTWTSGLAATPQRTRFRSSRAAGTMESLMTNLGRWMRPTLYLSSSALPIAQILRVPCRRALPTNASFLAETSVMPPWKLFIYIIFKIYFPDKSIQITVNLILRKEAMLSVLPIARTLLVPCRRALPTNASFLAETSVLPPWKLFIYIIFKKKSG